MIDFARGRAWFAGEVIAGRANELLAMLASGANFEELILASPVGPLFVEATQVLERALGIFERLGDRTGVMSTVIAMAYAQYGPVMHLSSSARHLEEIRRVTSRLSELVTESERARLDLQMLFGVHVYSRAKVVPDLALSRGEDAHRAARLQGDRTIEFLAAGGVAMSLLELGDVDGAERWIGLAAAAASMAPSRPRARQLETWRGMARAGAGDAEGMRRHLERAVAMATEGGRASARCEALARLAIEAARLVAAGTSDGSPRRGRRTGPGAGGARRAVGGAGEGAAAAPARARAVGRAGRRRAGHGRPRARRHPGRRHGRRCGPRGPPGRAPRGRQPGDRHPGGPGPARRGAAGGPGVRPGLPPVDAVQDRPGNGGRGDPRPMAHRARRARARRAGRPDGRAAPAGAPAGETAGATPGSAAPAAGPSLDDAERRLLQLLTEGRTNAEIAAELDLAEDDVAQRLARLLARLGTSSRAEATSLAFRGLAAVGSR